MNNDHVHPLFRDILNSFASACLLPSEKEEYEVDERWEVKELDKEIEPHTENEFI